MNRWNYTAAAIAAAITFASSAGYAARIQYHEVAVTNGGTISGRVVWKGPRVDVPPMVINKNVETCDRSGTGKRKSPRLLVSKSGGVANAVVYIETITEGKPMPRVPLSLNQKGCEYVPHITIAPRKSKITLISSDDILHNMHMLGVANYNIPFPDKNTVVKRMRKAGVARVQCDAGHGWMSAYIHVVNHPYYAITDEEGRFELKDVPPGQYTLKMWHEDWTVVNNVVKDGQIVGYEFGEPIEQSQAVAVGAGADVKVEFSLSKARSK